MNINIAIKLFVISLLLGLSIQAEARIDDAELEMIRTFIAQEQKPLLFNGIMAKNEVIAAPSERDEEKFRLSRKLLQGEIQHWNSRVRIVTSWPEDQAVRDIGDGFMEIVDLGHFYYHFNNKVNSRAEAVRRMVGSESESVINFIKGMDEFEQKFYGTAGDGLKNAHASMRNIAIVYLKEVVRFIDNRHNTALLHLYNENRKAYLNRKESRYAGEYLDEVNELIDFERLTQINSPDADPMAVAREIAGYSERIDEVKDLIDPYLKEQRRRGNKAHAERLQQSFDLLIDDFERSKEGFMYKHPTEAKRARL